MATKRGAVLDALKASLDAMSAVNGYLTPWAGGYASLPEDTPRGFPCYVIEEGVEEAETLADAYINWRSRVSLHGFAKTSAVAGVNVRETADGMIADLARAALADPTRSGHAIDTRVVSAERMTAVSPDVWIVVTVEILWRSRLTEPQAGV